MFEQHEVALRESGNELVLRIAGVEVVLDYAKVMKLVQRLEAWLQRRR